MNREAAGTVREQHSSLCPQGFSWVTRVAALLPGCQQAVVTRAASRGYGDIATPLLSLLPARAAPAGRRAAARALAGAGGKTSLLQGWKQVLLAPQLTPVSAFCRSSQDHTFDSSHRAGTGKFCPCIAQGEQKEITAQKCLSPAIPNVARPVPPNEETPLPPL